MRIVICTPLYPPDIEPSACYAQELATRLSREHEIIVLTYGSLPEPTSRVEVHGVSKESPLLVRLVKYFFALKVHARSAGAIIFENGPSVELPILACSFIARKRFLFHEGDDRARLARTRNWIHMLLHQALRARIHVHLQDTPPLKPEVLPFAPAPVLKYEQYEEAWQNHLTTITHYLA